MFTHFLCIRTILLSFWYWSMLVLFCLSLSFYLHLVCSVAPKSKFTPSRNPFRFGASSSNSTPSHVRFHDYKACKEFLENFLWHDIHSKHQVVLSNFFGTDLPTVIYSRGWESLCGIPVTYPSVIIQEFYSNMHEFDFSVPHFVTRVGGMCIVVTSDLIFEVLHVPRVEFANYPNCEHLRTVSKDKLSSHFCETPSS